MDKPDMNAVRQDIEAIIAELARIAREEPKRFDLWRITTAEKIMRDVRNAVDQPDLTDEQRYWHVAGNLRGIFCGWADSPSEFIAPNIVTDLMRPLYKRCLAAQNIST